MSLSPTQPSRIPLPTHPHTPTHIPTKPVSRILFPQARAGAHTHSKMEHPGLSKFPQLSAPSTPTPTTGRFPKPCSKTAPAELMSDWGSGEEVVVKRGGVVAQVSGELSSVQSGSRKGKGERKVGRLGRFVGRFRRPLFGPGKR